MWLFMMDISVRAELHQHLSLYGGSSVTDRTPTTYIAGFVEGMTCEAYPRGIVVGFGIEDLPSVSWCAASNTVGTFVRVSHMLASGAYPLAWPESVI